RILAALNEPTDFKFTEAQLGQVIDHFRKKHKVDLALDYRALDDAAIPITTPITKQGNEISLKSALGRICSDLDLTLVVQDEMLLLTTKSHADPIRLTRTY